jgi:DNA-directed RNA polymerase alpha subunit
MSSTQLDMYAAAAMQGLLVDRDWENVEELARESFRIARAMMAERMKQEELPDSGLIESTILDEKIERLELALRITKKLKGIGIETIRDLTLSTEKSIRDTGLGDESLSEIRNALHRHGLVLAAT